MESLDHLAAGGPDAEFEPAAGHIVETGRRHGEKGGRARVDGQDARGQCHPAGDGGQIAEPRYGIERVRLGDPDQVHPHPLVFDDLFRRRGELLFVAEGHPQTDLRIRSGVNIVVGHGPSLPSERMLAPA